MFENTNANLILEILRKESSNFMQANNFESAKKVVDALVWIKNIFESIDEQDNDSDIDPEVEKMQQALKSAYPLPAETEENVKPESTPSSKDDSEDDSKNKAKVKFPKTTQVEATKRKQWILNTIKSYGNGITDSQVLALYITSKEISHTESELMKTNPEDKEVRGYTLGAKYLSCLINKDKTVKRNDKGFLVAV